MILAEEQHQKLVSQHLELVQKVTELTADIAKATATIKNAIEALEPSTKTVNFLAEFIKKHGLEPPALPDLPPLN